MAANGEQREALLAEEGGWAAVPATACPRAGPSVAELLAASPDKVLATLQKEGVQAVASFSLPVRARRPRRCCAAAWRPTSVRTAR